MTVTPATVPLQILCQLMVAGQVGDNVTLPVNWNSASAGIADSSVLPPEYFAFPEFGLAYKSYDLDLTHNDARKKCLSENAQLAVLDSKAKVDKILEGFGHIQSVWAGVGQYGDADDWIRIDGKSTKDLPWGYGFPTGNYRCAYLNRGGGALVNNSCHNRYRFLCEIPLTKY